MAGLAAIAGALVLLVHVTYGTALQLQGVVPGYETIGSSAYYLSEGVLFLAWAGMFLGFAALRARMVGLESRLWDVGSALAAIGAALATIGFFVVTVVPAIGAMGIVDPGNMVIGLGLMVAITIGTFLMGVSLLRTGAMARSVAALFLLVLPTTLVAGPVGEALGVGPVIGLITFLPFIAAVIAVGRWLRREPRATIPDADPSA
ncbi:hypothetical protein SAMN05444422_107217 [Halobiforma haloterrestris]|uniref:Uncharacterized protein n=2 Tax=Natronobacterium haloterrestre TaxID=148448 RepID=A0A1I1IJL9_NATHA|nr:hypothetical protein SAMN05444422_107217 [Halobiforma haloterrestris]